MKKIIRIASVIALACASLVYVGCTKDFSADIAKTNQDVSALKSKVEALDATVQTINSTVANLQTTKADLSVVNALEASLNGKIDDLTADLEEAKADIKAASDAAAAAQLTAEGAQKAAEQAAADLKAAKAELDTVIAGVNEKIEVLEVNTDSLRKDVDSLYKNSANFSKRIDELEGRVNAIAARITSIVAVPSMNKEIRVYNIDTLGGSFQDTLFTATFAIAPSDAKVSAEDLSLVVKHGLTRYVATTDVKDTVNAIRSIVKNDDGTITVTANLESGLPIVRGDGSTISVYYSLVFAGKDAAGEEYVKQSEFVKAAVDEDVQYMYNIIKLVDNKDLEALAFNTNYAYEDTISYAEKADTVFNTVFGGKSPKVSVMAEIEENEFISLDEFAKVFGTTASKLNIDTIVYVSSEEILTTYNKGTYYPANDPGPWPDDYFNSGKPGNEELLKWFPSGAGSAIGNGILNPSESIFTKKKNTDNWYYGNRTTVYYNVKVGGNHPLKNTSTLIERLYIGAKEIAPIALEGKSIDWYYDVAVAGINKVYTIENEAAATALKGRALVDETEHFGVKGPKTGKVDTVKVAGIKYPVDGKEKTYDVKWAQGTNLAEKADSTSFTITWKFTVGARPADPATIEFEADTTVVGIKNLTFKFDIFKKSVEAVAELDNRVAIDSFKITKINGVEAAKSDIKVSGSVKPGSITIEKAKEGKYEIEAGAVCAGIKFTYKFTINVNKGKTPKFKALSTFVKEEEGTYSIEIAAPKPVHTHMQGNGSYVKALNTMAFNQYFVVDTTEAALEGLFAEFKQIDSTASKKNALLKATGSFAVKEDKVTFGDGKFEWNTYDSLTVNVAAYLVCKPEEVKDTIDQVNIKFWTKDPIKSVAHKDSTIKHNNTQADVINLNGLFTVKDYMDSTVIKNGVKNIIGSYEYGIEFNYGADSTWTITGGELPKGALTLSGSTLTLSAQGAQIVNPVTVEIPFIVKHDLDKFGKAADDRQGTVKVTFTSAE